MINAFHAGFMFFCMICLFGRVIASGKTKQEFINIHTAVNLSLAIGAILPILFIAALFYISYQESSGYEYWGIMEDGLNSFTIISIILGWLTGLLFFIRKLRSNWLLSAAVLILWNAGIILSWIMRTDTDDLASTWATDDKRYPFIILRILLFGVISFLIYLGLSKRKKLPYPSAWIR